MTALPFQRCITWSKKFIAMLLGNIIEATVPSNAAAQLIPLGDASVHPSFFYFQAKTKPSVFIADYVMRIAYNTNVSSEALVVSLILLHRLCGLHKNFPVNALSIHRTVLASIFASAKFVDDNVVRADHFAAAGGITKKELAGLELKFVFLIGFSLSVSEQEWDVAVKHLVVLNPMSPILQSIFQTNGLAYETAESKHTTTVNPAITDYFPPLPCDVFDAGVEASCAMVDEDGACSQHTQLSEKSTEKTSVSI